MVKRMTYPPPPPPRSYPPPPPRSYPPPPGHYPPPPGTHKPTTPRTGKPVAGGVILIVGSIALMLAIVGGIILFFVAVSMFASYGSDYGFGFNDICSFIGWGIGGIASILALIGGIMAVKRYSFSMAITGAICGIIMSLGAWGLCFICTIVWMILGIVALILIALSKKEFAK